MKKKVAIYCRVSTGMQSTDRQKVELLAYADSHNYEISNDMIFIDVISGFKKGEIRPQFSKMMDKVNQKEIDVILFSELTRLGRSSLELLQQIQELREKGVSMYFQKQELWVNADKGDFASTIVLNILAVTASYEIELFTERTLSGRIAKVQKGHGGGDEHAYGYMNADDKKMIINEDEAKVVRRIFEEYADGISSIQICEILNMEKIPTPYIRKIEEWKQNRKRKGLDEKAYTFNEDELKWRPSTLNRLLHNELYLGKRNIVFHKPDPTNNKPTWKREDREVVFEYKEQIEDLRIISDDLFERVQQRLLNAHYNKNNAVKHENLLKHKLICGECGANFSVGKTSESAKNYISGGRTYKCYGRVNRKDKPQTCKDGAEVRQWKMDGLVLSLSLYMFAEINIEETNEKKIAKLSADLSVSESLREEKVQQLNLLIENHKKVLRRLSISKSDDSIIMELINEENSDYAKKRQTLDSEIEKYEKEITSTRITIHRLKQLVENYVNMHDKMDEIRKSKELVRMMIDEYIDKIYVYKIHKFWNLIIVKYTNGAEMWATIKSARYKKEEMFFDELTCKYGIEFHAWLLNNTEQCFSYDKETHLINYNGESAIYHAIQKGTYTFEELNKILYDTKWIGSFPFYAYEDMEDKLHDKANLNPNFIKTLNNINNSQVDWNSHNSKVIKRLSKKN